MRVTFICRARVMSWGAKRLLGGFAIGECVIEWLLPCAGIPWLINKYKQYVLMRERLLNDTQKLRTKLQNSIPEPNTSGRPRYPAPRLVSTHA